MPSLAEVSAPDARWLTHLPVRLPGLAEHLRPAWRHRLATARQWPTGAWQISCNQA